MNAWADLESSLHEVAEFPCEEPDGRKDLPEIARAVTLRKLLHMCAPRVLLVPMANAGKRNPLQASREGIIAGAPDYLALWDFPARVDDRTCAFVEMKGYSRAGRPGTLSPEQIDFGNRLHRMGHKVACFFRPESALEWLKACGAPVTGRVTA